MIENLENIYIYIEDNFNIQFEPDFREMSNWANNVNICINADKELTCYKISGAKLLCENVTNHKLAGIIGKIMDRDVEKSCFISDYDLEDIIRKHDLDLELEDFKQGNILKKTDIGLGMSYYGTARYVLFDVNDLNEEYIQSVFFRSIGKPLEIFTTDRLIVREMCLEDMPEYYKLYESLNECDFVEELYPYEEECEFVKNYIQNMYTFFGYGLWLVFLKETGELIGRVGIENREIDNTTKQEIGYLIGKDYQEQGYAYEACEATIEYARTMLNLDELFACIHRDNFKSIALVEKLGFRIYARDIGDMNLYRLEIQTDQKCRLIRNVD